MFNDDDLELSLDTVFTEPPRPPIPEPSTAVYVRDTKMAEDADAWNQIVIRLVGTHPLWGNYLWNAARALASYLDGNHSLYRDRTVLELGAGGGLPSIVTVKNGALRVVLTDYPDADLIENMVHNVEVNVSRGVRSRVQIKGYTWGRPVEPLLDALPIALGSRRGFDLIILSDLIFNHSQHDALLTTCELALSPEYSAQSLVPSAPIVLVFFTHHRPHLAHRDMMFFTKARERGWNCKEILVKKYPPMFPDDSGEEAVRSTVHGWRLSRQASPRME